MQVWGLLCVRGHVKPYAGWGLLCVGGHVKQAGGKIFHLGKGEWWEGAAGEVCVKEMGGGDVCVCEREMRAESMLKTVRHEEKS